MMQAPSQPAVSKIGFFDSGLGGLTILRAVQKYMPQYDYVYFGDTANLPYGDKTEAHIFELTRDGIIRLFDEGARLVIVACNTASAESVRVLQNTLLQDMYADRKILGVIIPTIETLMNTESKRALLVATTRTVNSKKYENELIQRGSGIALHAVATPSLVAHIELGMYADAFQDLIAYIDQVVGEVDTLVLGCTHYTVLKELIREKYCMSLRVLSQDEIIPMKLEEYLQAHPEIEIKLTRNETQKILLSKESEMYHQIQKDFLTV